MSNLTFLISFLLFVVKFPIPDVSKVSLIPISTYRNHRPLPEVEDNDKLKQHLLQSAARDTGNEFCDHTNMLCLLIVLY